MSDLTRDDLVDRRKRYADLPADWHRDAFGDELDRVEGVIGRRERLAAALSEASAALLTELLSDPVDVDAAVICHQRKTALGALLEDTPPASLSSEPLLSVANEVYAQLPAAIPGDASTVPALDYSNELELFRLFGDPLAEEAPVRTVEDARAQAAIDGARERFSGWSTSLQMYAEQAASADVLLWLHGAASLIGDVESASVPLLTELRSLIGEANKARREQGLNWRPASRHVDVVAASQRFTNLFPPVRLHRAA